MKKTVFFLLAAALLMPVTMMADGYTELWKKVEEAAKKDLPRTQIEHLQTISAKAENGVLGIVIPKVEHQAAPQRRSIEVK